MTSVPYDAAVGRHVHIHVHGSNLGVWMEDPDASTWRTVLNPEVGGNGYGILSEDFSGSVGIVSHQGTSAATSCSLLRVGTNRTSGDDNVNTLDLATEAWVDEKFATVLTCPSDTDPGLPSNAVKKLEYDDGGNLINDGIFRYSYDAWNHLYDVRRQGPTDSPQVIATYTYDGFGRRIKKVVENSGDRNCSQTFYYTGLNLLEIRTIVSSTVDKPIQQFVWGTRSAYEAICMDIDTDGDGDCVDPGGSRHFSYCLDINYKVVALREGSTLVERYEYDPYGQVRIYQGFTSSSSQDNLLVVGQSLKWLDAGLPSNPILLPGHFHDVETGLFCGRHIFYNAMLAVGLGPWPDEEDEKALYQMGLDLYHYMTSPTEGSIRPSVPIQVPANAPTYYMNPSTTGKLAVGLFNFYHRATPGHFRWFNLAPKDVLVVEGPVVSDVLSEPCCQMYMQSARINGIRRIVQGQIAPALKCGETNLFSTWGSGPVYSYPSETLNSSGVDLALGVYRLDWRATCEVKKVCCCPAQCVSTCVTCDITWTIYDRYDYDKTGIILGWLGSDFDVVMQSSETYRDAWSSCQH
jgi:hypothetical protein